MTTPAPDYRAFATPKDWSAWLADHHRDTAELWVKYYKKASGKPSITWEQAVTEALCWGWIDGVRKSLDETSWIQRFTPRRKASVWSLKNRRNCEALIAEGRMQPAGQAQIDMAIADGRWDRAYGGGAELEMPADFLAALAENPAAAATYATLSRQNLFAIAYRITAAKLPKTRAKRIAELTAMLARGARPY